MTGKTHQLIGLTVGLATYLAITDPHYNPATFGVAAVTASVAALLPDLDRSSAKIWQVLPFGKVAGRIIDPFIAHRNFSHSILGVIIFAGLANKLFLLMPSYWGVESRVVSLVFTASFLSHLVADMLTVQGIPLLFPLERMFGLPPRPLEGARIVTGKWFENLIIFPLVNVVLAGLLIQNWSVIRQTLFR